jgi:small-conductance mechanosensitive channel
MIVMWRLFWPAVAFLVALVIGLTLRAALLAAARRWAGPGSGLTALANTVRGPSLLWVLVLGLWAALEVSDLPRRFAHPLGLALQASVIVSVTLTAAALLSALIRRSAERQALGAAVTGLGQAVTRVVVLLIGALVLLSSLGIQVTPILTALGVGGLAVALALQDTLSNLFAGLHILADRPIRVGDYVKVADNVEGFVVDIGWRSTRLRTLANNTIVIPNKRVAESIVTNYDMPEAFTGVSVKVIVDYSVDADRVEQVLTDEAARATREVPGMRSESAPVVRLIPGFGEIGLEFTVTCQVATIGDHPSAEHELRKRILRRLHAEKIPIPARARPIDFSESDGDRPRQGPDRTDQRQG